MSAIIDGRKLTCDVDTFTSIRDANEHYVYVDKTALIHRLTHEYRYVFLSRPRRFGKSTLLDTIGCYLEGRRELFAGLAMERLEATWTRHAVIRLDLSGTSSTLGFTEQLSDRLSVYEAELPQPHAPAVTPAARLARLIRELRKQRGCPVAILIDEYDAPLLNSWGTPEHDPIRCLLRDVFTVLKAAKDDIRFVFVTGIAKFTGLSLFSALNNLVNISFRPEYATICGLTQQEIVANYQPWLLELAAARHTDLEETLDALRLHYDGYHFAVDAAGGMVDVYNPFSVINSFGMAKIRDHWGSSGRTRYLEKFVPSFAEDVLSYEDICIDASFLESSDVMDPTENASFSTRPYAHFLYLTGYLTLQGLEGHRYRLGIPNMEVRNALYLLTSDRLGSRDRRKRENAENRLIEALEAGDVPQSMTSLAALIADVPYPCIDKDAMHVEERYRLVVYTLLSTLGFNVQVERPMSAGRIDVTLWTTHHIYIFELKLAGSGGLRGAVSQMVERGYARGLSGGWRDVLAVAVELGDDPDAGVTRWQQVEVKEK